MLCSNVTKIRGFWPDKSLGGAWKTITPQSMNAYPRQDLILEIHTVR
eukprot:COSAG01_NODE_7787_length_3057_cov_5.243746_2_plen_47_part_00